MFSNSSAFLGNTFKRMNHMAKRQGGWYCNMMMFLLFVIWIFVSSSADITRSTQGTDCFTTTNALGRTVVVAQIVYLGIVQCSVDRVASCNLYSITYFA